jgi:hypothetical protein
MPCVNVKIGGTRMIVDMAPPVRRIQSGGQEFLFEFHDFLGPCMVGKRGNPVSTFPPQRSPFWDALHWWLKQGKQVDADGNCIFKHEMKLVYITKQIGRNILILSSPDAFKDIEKKAADRTRLRFMKL